MYMEVARAISVGHVGQRCLILLNRKLFQSFELLKWLYLPQYTYYIPDSYVKRLPMRMAIFLQMNKVLSMHIEGATAVSMSQSCEIDFLFSKFRHCQSTCFIEMAVAPSIYIVQNLIICLKISNVIGNLFTNESGL